MITSRDTENRIHPTLGRVGRPMPTYCAAYRGLLRAKRAVQAKPDRVAKRYAQRCMVKVRYSANRKKGQWQAHGRYIARKTAVGERAVFGEPGVSASQLLRRWQEAGDPRMFKIVISPEFGERLHLRQLTEELMARVRSDLGVSRLEWIAAEHHNTDNPHVHVALRGIADGRELRLPREYIRYAIRRHAQNLATEQIGYRTPAQAREAQRRKSVQSTVERMPPKGKTR